MKLKIEFILMLTVMFILNACDSTPPSSVENNQSVKEEKLIPGELAPAAEDGWKNFGTPVTARIDTLQSRPSRPSASATDPREISTTTLDELNMSDPFILPDVETETYYLTSSGGSIYKSKDLKNWEGPYGAYDVTGTWMEGINRVAAAELQHIGDKYYYIATWRKQDELVDVVPRRYNVPRSQSMILASDKPEGPYKPLNPDPNYNYLPYNWSILDGTLWVEDGIPYMFFVHEWVQVIDGTMEYVQLSSDLSERITEPKCLFRASEAPWVREMTGQKEATYGMKLPGWVTDAPQLFRTQTGKLGMLWSSWGANRYAQGVAYSESGTIDGPWLQEENALKGDNSGHGMMFTTFDGKRLFIVHHVEGNGPRKPYLYEMDDSGDKLVLGKRYHP
ncbi:MAG TPA: glycoside hydrolase family 43 protein [Draconibacterium sp.]|nr:glycoside hydrolase family 43 protein [Draconibacterium sp.]